MHPYVVTESSSVGFENGGAEIIPKNQRNGNSEEADVKPIVLHPTDDDRILVESGAEMSLFYMRAPSLKN